jgi:hypothetical protein
LKLLARGLAINPVRILATAIETEININAATSFHPLEGILAIGSIGIHL